MSNLVIRRELEAGTMHQLLTKALGSCYTYVKNIISDPIATLESSAAESTSIKEATNIIRTIKGGSCFEWIHTIVLRPPREVTPADIELEYEPHNRPWYVV